MPHINLTKLDASKEILGGVAFTLAHNACHHFQCRYVKPKRICECVRDKKICESFFSYYVKQLRF